MREIHSRLARLYPEVDIAHMPAEHMQAHADGPPAECSSGADHTRPAAAQRLMHQPCAAEQSAGAQGALAQRDCVQNETGAADCSCASTAGHLISSQAASQAEDRNAPSHMSAISLQQRDASLEVDNTRPRVGCAGVPGPPEPEETAFCAQFVGNAPVAGDTYTWHVDADPSTLPDCRCVMVPPAL